jgi:hypothetical protein
VPFESELVVRRRRRWFIAALLAGLAYIIIGRWFPNPAINARSWRLAAWAISGVVYLGHILYERSSGSSARVLATHVATAVAIGGLALAAFGMAHSVAQTSTVRPEWLISLVAWPAITGIPAFLMALIVASTLERLPSRVARL